MVNAAVQPSLAECDFGHTQASNVWPANAWEDPVTRLLSFYEPADLGAEHAKPIEVLVQEDWGVFTYEKPEDVRQFLEHAVVDHAILKPGVLARLHVEHGVADHVALWEEFSQEIRRQNRYFPSTTLDLNDLEKSFESCADHVRRDSSLFRARVFEADRVVTADEMGAPPARYASAGRANPAGIPYLYLSFVERTAKHEVRASNQGEIIVGDFRVLEDLRVLNLANFHLPDIFEDDAVAGLLQYRYLKKLGSELGKPIKETDQQTDYVPTQYLCEYAKDRGFDGVVYPSAVDPNDSPGRNLVLFQTSKVEWKGTYRRYRVTKVQATFQKFES